MREIGGITVNVVDLEEEDQLLRRPVPAKGGGLRRIQMRDSRRKRIKGHAPLRVLLTTWHQKMERNCFRHCTWRRSFPPPPKREEWDPH